jgi:hypothetical protein
MIKHCIDEYDLILIDARINIQKACKELGSGMKIFQRKRKFPFPVNLSGTNNKLLKSSDLKHNIECLIENSSHLLIQGGKDFTYPCSLISEESLSTKEAVKNVMQSIF